MPSLTTNHFVFKDAALSPKSSCGTDKASGHVLDLKGQVEKLCRLIKQRYESPTEFIDKKAFLELAKPFLVQDLSSISFSLYSQAFKAQGPIQISGSCNSFSSLTSAEFQTFLREHADTFIERYKNGKWRGYTSCGPIASEVVDVLNSKFGKKCSTLEGIKHHAFNLVLVENQPYLIDFTFDQFLDYDRIKNKYWMKDITEPISYVGALIMPVDRMAFQFDSSGLLCASPI